MWAPAIEAQIWSRKPSRRRYISPWRFRCSPPPIRLVRAGLTP